MTIDGSINTVPNVKYDMENKSFSIEEGNYYTYPKGLFHSVYTTELAVTLCEKHDFEKNKPVIGAKNLDEKSDFVPLNESVSIDDILIEAKEKLMK
jgi:hypothetical protein